MPETQIVVLAGTPGQAKAEIASKIKNKLQECGFTLGIGNVETELLRLTDPNGPEGSNANLAKFIGQCPQDKIRSLWPNALNAAVAAAKRERPDYAIVVCSLQFYRSETFEFYSPVNLAALNAHKPQAILTLIDDIYDVYFRLSQSGEVFDILELQNRVVAPEPVRGQDLRALYKNALNLVIQSLLRILVWREKEIDAGATLSRNLTCKHQVLAAKHPLTTGIQLLLGKVPYAGKSLADSYPIYVSHPISRPRRDRAQKGEWPPFVSDLNLIAETLATAESSGRCVAPVMPTAIDEYRILDDGTFLQPHLSPRWPLMTADLMYVVPNAPEGEEPFASYDDYERRGLSRLFDPPLDGVGRRSGIPLGDAETSGMLRTLKEAIRLQMAGRDHLLVRQCPGFFLFRPVYDRGEFSSGVRSELHTYDQLRRWADNAASDVGRKIAFVHGSDDVKTYFGVDKPGEARGVVKTISTHMQKVAMDLVRKHQKTRQPNAPEKSVLNALRSPGEVKREVETIYDEMFPFPTEGSIGQEERITFEDASSSLVTELETRRTEALGVISGQYKYTFSRQDVVYTAPSAETVDSYVDVVEGLDDQVIMTRAAGRVREFFLDNLRDDSNASSVSRVATTT